MWHGYSHVRLLWGSLTDTLINVLATRPNYKVVDLWEDLDIPTIVHNNYVIVIATVVFMNRLSLLMTILRWLNLSG